MCIQLSLFSLGHNDADFNYIENNVDVDCTVVYRDEKVAIKWSLLDFLLDHDYCPATGTWQWSFGSQPNCAAFFSLFFFLQKFWDPKRIACQALVQNIRISYTIHVRLGTLFRAASFIWFEALGRGFGLVSSFSTLIYKTNGVHTMRPIRRTCWPFNTASHRPHGDLT